MRTKAQFEADIRAAIGRGTANDALLPVWIEEALNELENDHTWMWQRVEDDVAVTPGVNSNVVTLPWAVKAFKSIRFGVTEGSGAQLVTRYGTELVEVDPRQLVSIVPGYGGYYYMRDATTLVMDGRPTEAATLYVSGWVFSDWSSYDADDTPPVLARAYAGFKAYVMMVAAANLRSPELAQIWSGLRDRRLASMQAADIDFEWKGRRKLRIGMNDPEPA